METLRKRVKPKGRSIIVELPDEFQAKEYEMILIPIEEKNERKMTEEEFKIFLLNAPIMTEQDYTSIQEKREHLNKWK